MDTHPLPCQEKSVGEEQGERIGRHNALRDAFHSTGGCSISGPLSGGKVPAAREQQETGRYLPSLLVLWEGLTAWDVTVTHPLQVATLARAATTPGYASKRKMREVAEECKRQGIEFIPLAVRSLGGWEEVGERQVKKLGDWPAGADRHPQTDPEADCPPIER